VAAFTQFLNEATFLNSRINPRAFTFRKTAAGQVIFKALRDPISKSAMHMAISEFLDATLKKFQSISYISPLCAITEITRRYGKNQKKRGDMGKYVKFQKRGDMGK
jgi:hypothetical protein